MKRRRSASPHASRSPTSRSPRGTRASTRSPRSPGVVLSSHRLGASKGMINDSQGEDHNLNGSRRSSRSKKINYNEHDSSFEHSMNGMGSDSDAPTRRTRSTDHAIVVPIAKTRRARSSSPAQVTTAASRPNNSDSPRRSENLENGDASPPRSRSRRQKTTEAFFDSNHVRFSPSAKTASPGRWPLSRRHASKVARLRLQNVPSEDEQTEFNRRYSRDLRRRNKRKHSDYQEAETTEDDDVRDSSTDRGSRRRRSSVRAAAAKARRRLDDGEMEESSEDEEEEVVEADKVEAETSTRRSGRQSTKSAPSSAPASKEVKAKTDSQEAKDEEADEDLNGSQIRRSSRITSKRSEAAVNDDEEDEDSSDSETESTSASSEEVEEGGRPKRKRRPVNRLMYGTPSIKARTSSREESRRSRRSRRYSSDDDDDDNGGSKSSKRPLRRRSSRLTSRRMNRPRPANTRDSSSSSSRSSSPNTDEERFKRRKTKRMMIEMSKMRPMNMSKADVAKAIFRDRSKVGTSCADVSPMDVDLKTSFESVGGSAEHIRCLKEIVVLPLLYPEIFSKFNITPPRGVLFHGPPGTGKTLLARALAAECSNEHRKVSFFMRKGADCLNKWIGESERQLRLLFDQAYLMRPSIIFFDEIDGLAPVRSSRQDQIHSSIVSTLLALIDGLDNRGEVIVIGATNRIENIDPALRRPGRFDRELRFDLPSRDARREILTVHTKSWNPAIETILLDKLADKTIGYSGADLKGLCAEAVLRALRRRYPQVYKSNKKLGLDTEQVVVGEDDFLEAMAAMVPSTHRVYDQHQAPLPTYIKPLLSESVDKICQLVDSKHHRNFSFRPRVLIRGRPGQALSTYIGPAILHHLETLPCHVLNVATLYSNSARSPEEKLCHIMHEARRTVPSVLYIPDLTQLCMTEALKMAFLSLVANVQPTAPLLILAVVERNVERNDDEGSNDEEEDEDSIDNLVRRMFSTEEIFDVGKPNKDQRSAFFQPIFDAAKKPPLPKVEVEPQELEDLHEVSIPELRRLTEDEEKRLRRKEEVKLRELRIFLRDVWDKLNKNQKFYMFRQPVPLEELDDYEEFVKEPMDFDKMLTKLDNHEYGSAQSFLDDIDLIVSNATLYNADLTNDTNRFICHRAKALQDFAYAVIKAEMDTDFEDDCKEIMSRREKLTQELNQAPCTSGIANGANGNASKQENKDKPTLKKRAKKSSWSRGLLKPMKSPSSSSRRSLVNGNHNNSSDKIVNGGHNSGDETKENSSSDEDASEMSVEVSQSQELQIDQKELSSVKSKLIESTSKCSIELLERVYIRLMKSVNQFKDNWDRRQLAHDLRQIVNEIPQNE